ncbi:MAG: hypothetical protein DCC49_09995 [Acidobacteria bacterium]|nr:MAG: hypothetical protein DCC49_09995 [Acidobacteriota bacterium]
MTQTTPELDTSVADGSLVSDLSSTTRADRIRLILLIFFIALGVRLAYTVALGWRDYQLVADAQDYHFIAQALSDGQGFSRLGWDLAWRPTAFRPPLTPFLISLVYQVSPTNTLAARIMMCVIGALTAVMIAVAAVSAFPGRNKWRIGLVAGIGAALYPYLVIHSTSLLIEPVHALLVPVLLVMTLRAKRPVTIRMAIALGIVTAIIALNRPDGASYALLATIWVVTLGSSGFGLAAARRILLGALVLLSFIAVISPWWIRNYATFNTFIPSTTSTGDLILGANNPATYEPGVFYGYWSYEAVITGEAGAYSFADEVTADRKHTELGLNHIADHPLGYVAVMPIRVLRGWELWDPLGNARFGTSWGRPLWAGHIALVLYYPVLVAAIAGAIMARRRWRDLAPLYAIPAYVTLLFAFITGEMRYRAAVEPVLVIFAAYALVTVADRRKKRGEIASSGSSAGFAEVRDPLRPDLADSED